MSSLTNGFTLVSSSLDATTMHTAKFVLLTGFQEYVKLAVTPRYPDQTEYTRLNEIYNIDDCLKTHSSES